jgi:4-carboxymuconolactone decarboxylase
MVGRIRGLEPEEWGREVRAALTPTLGPVAALEGRVTAGSGPTVERQRPLNILTVMAHQPKLLAPFLAWASALVLEGVLSRRDHELLALRAASNCGSEFEWGHHVVYARAAGLGDEEIERVAAGPRAPGWAQDDAVLLQAADELHRSGTISDQTWNELADRLPPSALVELPLVVGQYSMLSMLANATGVETEPGYDPLPVPRTGPGH